MLLEHIVMCRLVMGNKSVALSEISQACQLCRHQPKLLQSHRSQLHVLLGLYAMSMNCMEQAEAQLISALNVFINFLNIFTNCFFSLLFKIIFFFSAIARKRISDICKFKFSYSLS